ncbi:hypothetical protein [Brucella anthropi]|uniref:hypothetical protein n=1 Tax=Brucella anthropi TaxID=529 RepID=UPI000A730A1B|nr:MULTISPECIES: hypothetical protein [Brucella/Ochrobactrum group]MCR8492769.1 hypothetical protein [Brucella anthropi]
MNKTVFFAYARRAPFGGRLSQAQVDGTSAILAMAERRGLPDEQTAYVLATAFHETGGKMQPIEKNLNYTSAARIRQVWPSRFSSVQSAQPYVRNPQALANKVYGGRIGNTGANDGWLYRGRGLAMITKRDNYEKYGLGVAPDKALEDGVAVRILFNGMINGKFTGKRLTDHFGSGWAAPQDARAIVNGSDKANKARKIEDETSKLGGGDVDAALSRWLRDSR